MDDRSSCQRLQILFAFSVPCLQALEHILKLSMPIISAGAVSITRRGGGISKILLKLNLTLSEKIVISSAVGGKEGSLPPPYHMPKYGNFLRCLTYSLLPPIQSASPLPLLLTVPPSFTMKSGSATVMHQSTGTKAKH